MASLNVESERTRRRAGEREEAVPNVLAEALITLTVLGHLVAWDARRNNTC